MSGPIRIGGISIGVGVNFSNFNKGLAAVEKTLKAKSRQFARLGGELTESFTLPLVAIGGAAVLAAREFEKATSTIRRGTGATGKDLAKLEKSFRDVFKAGDDTAAEVSSVLTDLNKRTGIVGEPLERLTNTILDLNDVTGADLSTTVKESTRLFENWKISTDNQVTTLDTLFKVSQQTGVGFSELQTKMVSSGVTLRELGFTFEESAALIGQFEKQGVNTGVVLAGLKKSVATFAKAGLDPAGGFKALIEDFKRTGDEAKLTERSIKIFGSKAGPELAKNIAGGRLEVDALVKSIKGSGETIQTAAEQSKTFDQRLGELRNTATFALEAFGTPILEKSIPILKSIIEQAAGLSAKFQELTPQTKNFALAFGGIVLLAGPVLKGVALLTTGVVAILGSFPLLLTAGLTAAFIAYGDQWLLEINKFGQKVGEKLALTAAKFRLLGQEMWKALDPTQTSQIDFTANKGFYTQASDIIEAQFAKIKTEAPKAAAGQKELADGTGLVATAMTKVNGIITETTNKLGLTTGATGVLASELDNLDPAAKKASQELLNLQKQVVDLKQEMEQSSLRSGIDEAIKAGNTASFNDLKQKFLAASRDGIIAGLDKSVQGSAAAQEYAGLLVGKLSDELDTEYRESMKAAHEESVDAWRKSFENAITGVKFNLKDVLQQVAVGFAAEIAAGVSGSMKGIGSPQDFGGSLAKQIMNSGFNTSDIFGSLFGGGRPAGVEGPLLPSGDFTPGVLSTDPGGLFAGAGSSASYITAFISAADALQKIGNSTKDTVKGISEGAGAAIGATFGGPVGATIGGQIGKFAGKGLVSVLGLGGSKDKGVLSRNAFTGQLTDMLKEIGGISFKGSDGGQVKLDSIDIFGGNNKFDGGGGFEFLNSLDEKARGTFSSLGLAFKEIFDLKDLAPEQAAAILSENLLGSIDNARLLVQSLGLDFDALKEKMLDAAKKGEIDWLEYNSAVRDLGEAFKPGLEGFAAVQGAVEELRESSGRGFKAVKGVRDIAQELIEAGATDLESAKNILIATGTGAEEAQRIVDSFAARGITSLEDLANASDEVAGSIAGDLKAAGFGFAEISKEVLTVKDALDQINNVKLAAKELEVKVVVTGEKEALNGQISQTINSSTAATNGSISGNASTNTRSSRRLNSSIGRNSSGNNVQINVDARDASNGTEQRVLHALATLEDRIVAQAVNAVYDLQQRGRL